MKIVLFGGTFDPWSSAHQEITERLSASYDKVLVIPTNVRYYKANAQMFTFEERISMVRQQVFPLKNVEVSDVEKDVDSSWRFVHTLQKIRELYGTINQYYVAVGSDSLQKFTTWYEWQTILSLSKLVVFNRPGYTDGFPDIPYEYLPMENSISSTQLRKEIAQEQSDDFLDDLMDQCWYEDGIKNLMEDEL